MAQNDSHDLQWLLNDVVGRVSEAEQAIVLSDDGLLMAASSGVSRDDAERLAAVASGYKSLSRGAGGVIDGGSVRQITIEMDSAFLFVTSAGKRACLAVVGSAESDIGLIAYEMAVLVRRVGASLSTKERTREPRRAVV